MSPLPDAKPDKRIYQLLKTTDLQNLTFSDFQKVAETIFAEQGAEDELRRIVLINLARLSIAGEWSGLTSSGGGGSVSQSPMPLGTQITATYKYFQPTDAQKLTVVENTNAPLEEYPQYFRFVAAKSGNVGTMTMRTNSNNSGLDKAFVAIYDSTDTGYPKDRLGTIEIDVNGTAGLYSSSSWSSTVTLTAGSTYWWAVVSKGSAPPTVNQYSNAGDDFLALGMTHYPGTPYNCVFGSGGSQHTLPSTFVFSEGSLARQNMPNWGYEYA
tara:strand:+ start:563 stop:1369 length:807 start_codon:yes stop_codon:yes gene_type:complete